MLYDCIKFIHILSATLVLTGMGYCVHLWRIAKVNKSALNGIQSLTWVLIAPLTFLQLATGFTMISLKHFLISEFWIKGSIIAFIFLISSWFGFVYLLLSPKSSRLAQSIILLICSMSVVSMLFFMADRI
jgi:hypothetical protein